MKDQFIPYELALKLKELGFDCDCFGRYYIFVKHFPIQIEIGYFVKENDAFINTPLWQQAFDWFETKYSLFATFDKVDNTKTYYYDFSIIDSKDREYHDLDMIDQAKRKSDYNEYDSYLLAKEACLLKLIDIIKNRL